MPETDEFFVTLPSNVKSDSSTINTSANFRTTLPECINLSGDWLVALVEISYMHSFNNLHDKPTGSNEIKFTNRSDVEFTATVQPGFYSSINDLLDAIANAIKHATPTKVPTQVEMQQDNIPDNIEMIDTRIKSVPFFTFDWYLKKITLSYSAQHVKTVTISEQLKYILGFDLEYGKNHIRMIRSREDAIIHVVAKHPTDLFNGQYSIFVYCDIIENQIVGNVRAPLLQIVPIKGIHNEVTTHSFLTPHYVPVLKKTFDTIQISIKNDENSFVLFEYGKTIVKLHFKRNKNFF